MADDEFRRVAEDIRALARSLGHDFRSAVDDARRKGHPPGQAVKFGLRGVADEARRGLREGLGGRQRGQWGQWGDWGDWGGSWGPRGPWCHPGHRGRGRKLWAPPPVGSPVSPRGGPEGGVPERSKAWAPPRSHGRSQAAWSPPGRPAPGGRRHRSLPPVRRRWDATTVLGMLAVLFGVAWLLGAIHAVHLSIEGVVAVGLMLLGAALVITGRTDWSLSRRSWPVWLGLGMILVLIATSSTLGLGGAAHDISFGNKAVALMTPGQVVRNGFGNLTVSVPAQGGTYTAVNIAGNIYIDPPTNAAVTVNARVFGGQICVNGVNESNGLSAQYHSQISNGAVPVTIDTHEVFGQIVIGAPGVGCRGR